MTVDLTAGRKSDVDSADLSSIDLLVLNFGFSNDAKASDGVSEVLKFFSTAS